MKNIIRNQLKKLYTRNTLESKNGVLSFVLKNRLLSIEVVEINYLTIGEKNIKCEDILFSNNENECVPLRNALASKSLNFVLGSSIQILVNTDVQNNPKAEIEISFSVKVKKYGDLVIRIFDIPNTDKIDKNGLSDNIPRYEINDFSNQIIEARNLFIKDRCGVEINRIKDYTIEPSVFKGNIENFIGVSQMPIGLAGPIRISGSFAKGDFFVPLATTEGTLVASYNRGMKIMNDCGGIKTLIIDDSMQRAPVFQFSNVTEAYEFSLWLSSSITIIKNLAEKTSNHLKFKNYEKYIFGSIVYLRFNFHTGDAAGQNMVTKATLAIFEYLSVSSPFEPRRMYLESNIATDKKPSFINTLNGRGKKVVAEAVLNKELLLSKYNIDLTNLVDHSYLGMLGTIISNANNNALHSVNGITAIFAATGQDIANVSEGSSAILSTDWLENGDLYLSITLPSLIVATVGGGTGLPTQNECLKIMQCDGINGSKKLAEVIAATVLAGELSLAAAISNGDWVESHERMGKNRI